MVTRQMVTSWLHWSWAMGRFIPAWLINRPLEWEDQATGEVEYEQWNRKAVWRLRPRWWGGLKELDCGCSTRFGRMVLFSMDCETHSPGTARWMKEDSDGPDEDPAA